MVSRKTADLARKLYNEHGEDEACDMLGVSASSLRRYVGLSKQFEADDEDEFGAIATASAGDVRGTKTITGDAFDIDDFIREYKIDLNVWEIVTYSIESGFWDVASKEREQDLKWTIETDDKGKKYQLMEGTATRGDWKTKKNGKSSIKVTLRKKKVVFDADKFKSELVESVNLTAPYVPKIQHNDAGEHMLEINIFDLHLGKLAWAPETGDNYDSKIAQQRFFDSIEYFVNMASMFKIDRILFPFGSDFFNADSDYPFPATTAGTPQDNDLRWQKSFKIGREMIIKAVNRLAQVAPVTLVGIPGNHDFQKTFYLGDVLDVRYENDENVTVDNSPKTRKYYRYGENLIGFTHGNDMPESRLLMLMPQEEPLMWAKTKYREWHCGHLHHSKKVITKSSEDIQGISIKYMRALKGTDEWEAKKGYIGSVGGAEAYIWHKDKGLVANFNYNL